MKRIIVTLTLLAVLAFAAGAQDTMLTTTEGPFALSLVAETGAVKVLTHTIQIGATDDVFNYVTEGGQDILFPFTRYSAELSIFDQHSVIFLYQPLEFATQVRFDDPRTIDGVTFDANEGVNIVYSFPFYRASYLYDFAAAPELELAAGLSLQLRNASIRWASVNGDQGDLVSSQNLGPVPIVKLRAGYTFAELQGAFLELEADAFYASSAFINGATYAFEGSIFDVSLRGGFEPAPGLEVFANLRGLGGGGSGTRPAS
ncbi:MAG: hypothetical protein ACOC1I_06345, partial [Spirochaetota bacterium]